MRVLKRVWFVLSAIAVVLVLAIAWFKFGEPWLKHRATLRTIEELETEQVEIEILNEHLITFLQRHHGCEGDRDVIVFVHGYGGHPVRTWGETFAGLNQAPYENPDLAWLKCLDAISVSYPTGLARGGSIEGAASRLRDIVGRHVMQKEYDRVYFVAHSMGGLVVQRALLDFLHEGDPEAKSGYLPRIKAIAYFDTPHDGLALRDGTGTVAWFAQLEGETDEMAAGSEFRSRLHDSWRRAFESETEGARRVFVERAWIFEADETAQMVNVVDGLKYKHFKDPITGRKASAQTVAGKSHTSICKTRAADLVSGRGYFHDFVVPLLGRHEAITGIGKTPWGLSRSRDGEWIYVSSQNVTAGGVKRIRTLDYTLDADWEIAVGERVHDFVEVETGSGLLGVATDLGEAGVIDDSGITLVDLESGDMRRVVVDGRPDDLDAHGNLVVVSDNERGHVWLFDAKAGRVVSEIRLTDASGDAMKIRGARFIRDGQQVLACGDLSLNSEISHLFLLGIGPGHRLVELDRVVTRPSPAEVAFVESRDLACAASWKEPGAVVCHRLDGNTLGPQQEVIEFTGSVQPAALVVAGDGDAETLFVAGQDGTAKKIHWHDGEPVVHSYEHGGAESWAVETDAEGKRVYLTTGADGTVLVLDAGSQQWVLTADGRSESPNGAAPSMDVIDDPPHEVGASPRREGVAEADVAR